VSSEVVVDEEHRAGEQFGAEPAGPVRGTEPSADLTATTVESDRSGEPFAGLVDGDEKRSGRSCRLS
jgi:hypothetical protein